MRRREGEGERESCREREGDGWAGKVEGLPRDFAPRGSKAGLAGVGPHERKGETDSALRRVTACASPSYCRVGSSYCGIITTVAAHERRRVKGRAFAFC